MGSKPFSFDTDDLKSLGWTLLDVMSAAAATEVLAFMSDQASESATMVAVFGVLTVLIKAGRKWVVDNTKRWRKVVG